MKRVLVTGGAGFIGSYIVDELLARKFKVRILDALDPQVHGKTRKVPDWTRQQLKSGRAEFLRGDVNNPRTVESALKGVDVIFHEAAVVGVGQSMYQIEYYSRHNMQGTSVLLDVLANKKHKVRKLLVASSMSIYGEGAYRCGTCGEVHPELRSNEQLARREWEMACTKCGKQAEAVPTPESKPCFSTSVYAISKKVQEEMCLCVGRAYGIPTVALRYFNAIGPRQALSNPYTGVAAIFSSRLLNNHRPLVYEDGLQSRDFVSVKDIARANLMAMESDEANFEAINIGTGRPTSVAEVARLLAHALGKPIEPEVLNSFRQGDIRHCYADIGKARTLLGYEPSVRVEEWIPRLIEWVRTQQPKDRVEQAKKELEKRGLTS
ncbi:MAG: NAD-dependent epimerase/dehydratase family protein [Nitrospirae bacterium]|nr:NAD-dependent epimerase/dehydratase family protein [Nitrospirota bacterium]